MKNFVYGFLKLIKKNLLTFFSLPVAAYLTHVINANCTLSFIQWSFLFAYFVVFLSFLFFLSQKYIFAKKIFDKISLRLVGIASIIVFVFAYQFFIPVNSVPVTITINSINRENNLSNGEIWLTACEKNGDDYPVSSLNCFDNVGWVYNSEFDDYVYYPNVSNNVNKLLLELPAGQIKLKFATNTWSGIVQIQTDLQNETLNLFTSNLEQEFILLSINNNIPYNFFELILYGFSALLLIIWALMIYIHLRKTNIIDVFYLCFVFCSCRLASVYHIMEIKTSLVVFLIICLISFFIFKNRYDVFFMKKLYNSKGYIGGLLLALVVSFFIFGSRVFLPIHKMFINWYDILVFLTLTIALLPILWTSIFLLHKVIFKIGNNFKLNEKLVTEKLDLTRSSLRQIIFAIIFAFGYTILFYILSKPIFYQGMEKNYFQLVHCIVVTVIFVLAFLLFKNILDLLLYKRCHSIKFFLCSFGILFFTWLLSLLLFNPGIVSYDTFHQIAQAKGYTQYNDMHPVFYTLLLKIILNIFGTATAIAVVQIVFLALIFSSFTTFLYQKGLSGAQLLIFLFLFAIVPNNFILSVAIWKDIVYTGSLAWVSIIIFKFVGDATVAKKTTFLLQLAVSMVLIALTRHNGMIVYVVLFLLIIYLAIQSKNCQLFIPLICSVLVIMGIKGPLYQNLNIITQGNMASVSPIHGMGYVLYEGEELPVPAIEQMEKIAPKRFWIDNYNMYNSNSYLFDYEATQLMVMEKIKNTDTKVILNAYFNTLLKSPYLLIKARLYPTTVLWDVGIWDTPVYYYDEIPYNSSNFPQLVIQHIETPFTSVMYKFLETTRKTFITNALFWRAGIYLIISIMLLYIAAIKKQFRVFFVAAPTLVNIFTLMLSMAWLDYRYVYFIFINTIIILLSCCLSYNENKSKEEKNNEKA